MSTTLDLANLSPDAILRLWEATRRVHAARASDPRLRADILRRCQQLEDGDLAATIRAELDETHPGVVLEAHWRELIPNRPALGAFPRHELIATGSPDQWIKDDPRRLTGVVHEMARFTENLKEIAQGALDLADRLGIDEQEADRIVCAAFRDSGGGQHHAS